MNNAKNIELIGDGEFIAKLKQLTGNIMISSSTTEKPLFGNIEIHFEHGRRTIIRKNEVIK